MDTHALTEDNLVDAVWEDCIRLAERLGGYEWSLGSLTESVNLFSFGVDLDPSEDDMSIMARFEEMPEVPGTSTPLVVLESYWVHCLFKSRVPFDLSANGSSGVYRFYSRFPEIIDAIASNERVAALLESIPGGAKPFDSQTAFKEKDAIPLFPLSDNTTFDEYIDRAELAQFLVGFILYQYIPGANVSPDFKQEREVLAAEPVDTYYLILKEIISTLKDLGLGTRRNINN